MKFSIEATVEREIKSEAVSHVCSMTVAPRRWSQRVGFRNLILGARDQVTTDMALDDFMLHQPI